MAYNERPLPIYNHFKTARRIAHEYCEAHHLPEDVEQNLEIELRSLIIAVHNESVKNIGANIIKEFTNMVNLKFGYK